MSASTPTRTLDESGSAIGSRDLALKIFSGTVYEAFRAKTVFWDNTGNILASKMLTNQGNTAQWPIIGDDAGVEPIYHNPGHELLGQQIKMSEGTVKVDEVLVSHVDVPFSDMDLAHFDVLAPFATKLGRALAIDMDKKLAVLAVKAARTAAASNIHAGGKSVVRIDGVTHATDPASISAAYPNSSTGSGYFRDDVAELAQKFDEDNVPEEGRYLFIPPYIRTIMRHEGSSWGSNQGTLATVSATHPQIHSGPAGNPYSREMNSAPWDLNRRIIGMMEGFQVILTNHLPTADTTFQAAATGKLAAAAKYVGKFSGLDDSGDSDSDGGAYAIAEAKANAKPACVALCGASEGSAALGLVQAAGLRAVIEDDERRNTRFLKAQMMVGADVLCPWTAGYVGVYT
jgi:hypothetical protein